MSATDKIDLEVLRLRRNPWVVAASCIPLAVVPFLILASALTGKPFVAVAPHFTILGAVLFLATWRRMPYPRYLKSHIRVDDASVRLGNDEIPRAEITNVEIVPTDDSPMIRIQRRGRLVPDLLVARDDEQAHAILSALGFDASQRTAAYRLRSLALVRFRVLLLALLPLACAVMFLAGRVTPELTPAMLPIALGAFVVALLKRASLVVGADGILLRWLWVREFIATKDIVGTTRFVVGMGKNRVRGIEVMTKRGESLKLPVSTAWGETAMATIEQRIRDIVDLDKRAAHADDEALLLARGDLAMRDWIGRLKAIGVGATATLRTAAVMPEQLWRVASDAAQPPIARAAAAVALAPSLDAAGRVRLADLAKSTAAPKLRVALEHAAEDADEDTLEKALSEMED